MLDASRPRTVTVNLACVVRRLAACENPEAAHAFSHTTNERDTMTETALDELGPVDYLVVEFPAGASNFTGEMARSWSPLSTPARSA